MASAGISSSVARANRSPIRAAPSRSEYSECVCRWTKLLPAMALSTTLGKVRSQAVEPLWAPCGKNHTPVIPTSRRLRPPPGGVKRTGRRRVDSIRGGGSDAQVARGPGAPAVRLPDQVCVQRVLVGIVRVEAPAELVVAVPPERHQLEQARGAGGGVPGGRLVAALAPGDAPRDLSVGAVAPQRGDEG